MKLEFVLWLQDEIDEHARKMACEKLCKPSHNISDLSARDRDSGSDYGEDKNPSCGFF